MSKHTPRPWRSNGCEIIGHSRIVATVAWCSGMEEEDRANINLIVAAPCLLEALEGMIGNFGLLDIRECTQEELSAVQSARAAIAKAKGEV